jgi:signal transduction histidine kinase
MSERLPGGFGPRLTGGAERRAAEHSVLEQALTVIAMLENAVMSRLVAMAHDPAGSHPAGNGFRGVWARIWREPFSRRTWAEFRYTAVALPLGIIGFFFTIASLCIGAMLAVTFFGLPLIAASSRGARYLGAVNRRAARHFLGLRVAAPDPFRPRPGFFGWLQSGLTDRTAWRARAYLILKLPMGVASLWASVALRVLAVAGVVSSLRGHAGNMFLGVLLWLAAPWVVRLILQLDRLLIRGLLGPTTLSQRVQDLEQARAEAIDDAAARLRRIERDLHDGTQADLVALAMRLGLAKEKLGAGSDADVARARELVDTAHRAAKEAIVELRDLARGIHPPALDSGLEAALSTLAARSAVPVELVADIPQRPSPAIETIAYFCAAELLTNVAKHSGARHATLEAIHVDGLLRVRVADDGHGGARLDGGRGLAGLASRVRTVDGRLDITSPAGGPTVVTAELPSHA